MIPPRIIVGYRSMYTHQFKEETYGLEAITIKVGYATTIKISKRSKNSILKIGNKKTWENKIDLKLEKKTINNEMKFGFKIRTIFNKKQEFLLFHSRTAPFYRLI